MRVLVVEDEALIARALREGLEADGYSVDVADRGDDGLWHATEQSYDAIILDLMLPGMNGYVVCRELRAKGITTPVMMLTGSMLVASATVTHLELGLATTAESPKCTAVMSRTHTSWARSDDDARRCARCKHRPRRQACRMHKAK